MGKKKQLPSLYKDSLAILAEHIHISETVDKTPICAYCGWKMEWSEEREIDLDGGFVTGVEQVYRCFNPECDGDKEEEL